MKGPHCVIDILFGTTEQTFMRAKSEITIYDIARALELSASTVSRALNGSALIRQETTKKILEKARDLGYRQNFFASRLRSQRANIIAAMLPQVNTSFMSNVVAGAEVAARRLNYRMVISQSMNNYETYRSDLESIETSWVDGLLLMSAFFHNNDAFKQRINSLPLPVVTIEACCSLSHRSKGNPGNNYETIYQLTTYLAKKGCKNIAFVSVALENETRTDLLKGYRNALDRNGLSIRPVIVDFEQHRNDPWPGLMSGATPPDGIILINGIIAALSIPRVSLPGDSGGRVNENINNTTACPDIKIDFSAHEHHIQSLGRAAISLLTSVIESTLEE